MADYNSSLPVRTQNNGDIKANLTDGTTESIVNTIKAASTAAVSTDTALVVALSPNSPLPAGTASIGSVTQGTSPWVTSDLADGSVTGGTAGTKYLLAGGQYNTSAPTLTAAQQAALQLDVNGNLKVDLATALPSGTNAIGSVLANLQVASAPVTSSNPVPVTISSSSSGTAVQSFTDLSSIAVGSTATATYTVAASHTFNLQHLFISSSGKIKAVVSASGSTIFTGFNSTANPNIDITVVTAPLVAAAGTVTVAVTNLDLSAADAYVTIEGNQN